jgi:hypothetical protein
VNAPAYRPVLPSPAGVVVEQIWTSITPLGLLPTAHPNWLEWVDTWALACSLEAMGPWVLGDAYVIGENEFEEQASQVLENRRQSLKTIRNYASTCRRWPYSRRRASVHFSHHAVLNSLPDARQELWLNRVETEDLSVDQLEDMTAEERGVEAPADLAPIDLLLQAEDLLEQAQVLVGETSAEWGLIGRVLKVLGTVLHAFGAERKEAA